jgi:hypothetical protein
MHTLIGVFYLHFRYIFHPQTHTHTCCWVNAKEDVLGYDVGVTFLREHVVYVLGTEDRLL